MIKQSLKYFFKTRVIYVSFCSHLVHSLRTKIRNKIIHVFHLVHSMLKSCGINEHKMCKAAIPNQCAVEFQKCETTFCNQTLHLILK
jgi:hypothetical protein